MSGTATLREQLEELERRSLAPQAALSAQTRGRQHPLEPCPLRTEYQRDRDRIIHSKAFRRLKHKTQVFLSPSGDHYRTRLTHTLEVTQVARTIARALRLNEDLVEAIGYGHDLGHTPFGHAGERALNKVHPEGFHHVFQSLRVVDLLERDGHGLNLTEEVRDGILKHSKGFGKINALNKNSTPLTLEGQILRFADVIAYSNHDLDDGLRAGLLHESDIPEQVVRLLGASHGERIGTLIRGVVEGTQANGLTKLDMLPELAEGLQVLRSFLQDQLYIPDKAGSEEERINKVISELYGYFLDHPEQIDMPHIEEPELSAEQALHARVKDYIASMTDRFALESYQRVFLPRAWPG